MDRKPPTKHVAIIHGSRGDRQSVVAAIRGYYTISEYDNANVAKDYFQVVPPDIVVVSDMVMPDGGYNFTSALRADRQLSEIPVVIMSSLELREIRESIVKCGGNGYLPQPCPAGAALKAISAVMNRVVERKWETLPETEKVALKGTLDVLSGVPEAMAKGVPLDYALVKASCLPLIDLVYQGHVRTVLDAVKEHDNYTFVHSFKVGTMLAIFGRAIGLSAADQQLLACGGLLHDVGKMAIPHAVLNKPGRLNTEEFKVMQSHVRITVEFLEGSGDVPKGALIIAGQHHEKIDGSGYPRGIRGSELNELARMAAIVDIYGALTDRRVYKAGMDPEQALALMGREMANHIDLGLLKMFRQTVLDQTLSG